MLPLLLAVVVGNIILQVIEKKNLLGLENFDAEEFDAEEFDADED